MALPVCWLFVTTPHHLHLYYNVLPVGYLPIPRTLPAPCYSSGSTPVLPGCAYLRARGCLRLATPIRTPFPPDAPPARTTTTRSLDRLPTLPRLCTTENAQLLTYPVRRFRFAAPTATGVTLLQCHLHATPSTYRVAIQRLTLMPTHLHRYRLPQRGRAYRRKLRRYNLRLLPVYAYLTYFAKTALTTFFNRSPPFGSFALFCGTF